MYISFMTRFVDGNDPDILIHMYDFGIMCSLNDSKQMRTIIPFVPCLNSLDLRGGILRVALVCKGMLYQSRDVERPYKHHYSISQ